MRTTTLGTLGALGLGTLHAAPAVTVLGALASRQPASLGSWCTWRAPSAAGRAVALTLDDGPEPGSCERTLALLGELGMVATFFVLGEAAHAHPRLVAKIAAEGHEVATHGYHHAHHLLRSPAWVRADLERSLEVISAAAPRPRFFRPPFGQSAAATWRAAREFGLELVLWSAWGREFADRDVDRVLARLEPRLRPGAIVLLHDADAKASAGTAARTHEVLPRLAASLAAAGLRTLTLSALLKRDAR